MINALTFDFDWPHIILLEFVSVLMHPTIKLKYSLHHFTNPFQIYNCIDLIYPTTFLNTGGIIIRSIIVWFRYVPFGLDIVLKSPPEISDRYLPTPQHFGHRNSIWISIKTYQSFGIPLTFDFEPTNKSLLEVSAYYLSNKIISYNGTIEPHGTIEPIFNNQPIV
ncbi:hypothetical protein FF38_04422 [Lucilia cuprina]|uniref:Uncharacterized protein n=1 Tax=Lucilia cuprina TaxID=7375 RepID=A0A0L0BRQ1_LUCCU|nr:hypothetical protein FF38_04422 [Lucilia cuprina]